MGVAGEMGAVHWVSDFLKLSEHTLVGEIL